LVVVPVQDEVEFAPTVLIPGPNPGADAGRRITRSQSRDMDKTRRCLEATQAPTSASGELHSEDEDPNFTDALSEPSAAAPPSKPPHPCKTSSI
jgi:hypothetical protein